MIWDKDNYKSDINAIIGHTIVEYDMKAANTSLAREFHLLPLDRIEEIERMPKEKREITIGLIKRDDKEYSEREKQAFISARRMFIEENDLDISDILAIKRDAIFTLKYVDKEKVSKNINFRMKNEYSSYIRLNVEIFYNNEKLDIKGIDDEIYTNRHSEYFGKFIHNVIRRAEFGDSYETNEYIANMWDKYKWRELDTEYYREFNAKSEYRYLDGTYSIEEYRGNKNDLDISFNIPIITGLIQAII